MPTPIDMFIIMTNEYGYSSAFTLYGVEISDEGGVISTENMALEMSVQYTAVAMDPIVQAKADENGYIDPYGILQGSYSQFWKQRELVINGVAYSDLAEAYDAQYEAVDQTIRAINVAMHSTEKDNANKDILDRQGKENSETGKTTDTVSTVTPVNTGPKVTPAKSVVTSSF